jgi:hypothetical protein
MPPPYLKMNHSFDNIFAGQYLEQKFQGQSRYTLYSVCI